MANTFNLDVARMERDMAIAAVSGSNARWIDDAFLVAAALPSGWVGTGEDIRREVELVASGPGHHNAWGALIALLAKRRVLIKTGRYMNMKLKRSHARMTPEYVRADIGVS